MNAIDIPTPPTSPHWLNQPQSWNFADNKLTITAPAKADWFIDPQGAVWDLIRNFTLEANRNAQMGFEAQSPTGNGCTASFGDIHFEERLLTDIRSGE